MGKLNQIIAIEKGIKSQTTSALSEAYKTAQKAELFNGFHKHYEKKDDDGDDLPPESKRVAFRVGDMLRVVERAMSELIDVTARKDFTNCVAKGDIIVDGETLVSGVPATHLLFLEKQLTDVRTFIGHLPVLDAADDWTKDENSGLFKTAAVKTHRTKKVPKPIVLYPATPEHPAQTQMAAEDIIAGYWVNVKHSAAIPAPLKEEIYGRVEKLLIATKEAREQANMQDEVTLPQVSAKVFAYLMPQG